MTSSTTPPAPDGKTSYGLRQFVQVLGPVLGGGSVLLVPSDVQAKLFPPATISLLCGFGALASFIAFQRFQDLRAGRTATGHLAIDGALAKLMRCDPEVFTSEELLRRRKVNRHIARLARAVESIPAGVGVRDQEIVTSAAERAAGLMTLRVRVAHLDANDKDAIAQELEHAKVLYDSGQWLDLPVGPIAPRPPMSSGARVLWSLVALISLAGIIAVVVLAAAGMIPQSAAASLPFAFGLVLSAALARLGMSPDNVKRAFDLTQSAKVTKAA